MSDIDNPIAQIKKGAEKPPRTPGDAIAVGMISWIPIIGDKIKKALESIRGQDKDARIEFLLTAIVEQLEVHDTDIDVLKRLDQPEFNRLLSVAIERIFFGANQRKVKRFAAVVTEAAINEKTEQEYEDAASFIRALDELSEDDLRVLKLFFHYQQDLVIERHAMPHAIFFDGTRMTRLQEGILQLGMQIDDANSRSNRLVGYGLLLPLERTQAQGDINVKYFRMTLLGKRLMLILIKVGNETPEFRSVRS